MTAPRKYRDAMNRRGISFKMEAAPVIRRVRLLHRKGMSITRIAKEAGVAVPTVHSLLRGYRCEKGTTVPLTVVHVKTGLAIASVKYIEPKGEPGDHEGARMDPTGSQRRLQALIAAGYPAAWLSRRISTRDWFVRDVLSSIYTHASTAQRIAVFYDKHILVDPVEAGVRADQASGARNRARKRGYAPGSCWDVDTIDDPSAIPEWTGRCGTVFGWRVHQVEGIPVCPPCAAARRSEKAVFSGALFRARREKLGYSRIQLAKEVGVNPSSVQYWETGRSLPTRSKGFDLALRVLDVTYEEVCLPIEQEKRP